MAISEKVQLLGAGLYTGIPDELTIKGIPTSLELDYVGAEDFDATMIDTILPQAIEEDINFKDLLEIDYMWLCRCLRILNYGPYHTVSAIFCSDCETTSRGSYSVNLNAVECKPLPKDFKNEIVIKGDEFIDFNEDIIIKLPTIQNVLNAYKDKAFQLNNGSINREFARMCYSIKSIKGKDNLTPLEIKMIIQNELSAADYRMLKGIMDELLDYGMRAGGHTQCPKCGSNNAWFAAYIDDRFFRPTVGDLRKWKNSRDKRNDKKLSRSKTTNV